ncbi:hypothetical protein AYO22_05779 [Fonsecaea multimorphosa]|nr:hypothetical protein AYO22_05779 [Fonsecaea multimorphosa]
MPFSDFIDVSIHVDGAPLAEYPVPGRGREWLRHTKTRYVEVKAGQKFAVVIQLQPGFQFLSASHLRAVLHIDQEPRSTTAIIQGYPGCATGQDVLRAPRETRIETRLMRDETTGNWYQYGLEFADLHVEESSSLPEGVSRNSIAHLGSLRLTLFRANRVKLEDPFVYTASLTKPLENVPETALKGRDVTNNVKYVVEAEAPPPVLGFSKYVPLEGDHGQPWEFVFLYRKRQILQSLGCIPRSLSPPPDPAVMLARTEEMLGETKERARTQILELQARLAKAETARHVNGTISRNGNPTKRTRDQAQLDDDDDELLVLPPPPAKPRVVIDLTDE